MREKVNIEWWVPGVAIFGVKKYSNMLSVLQKERNVEPHFQQVVTAGDKDTKTVTFKNVANGELSVEKYDLLVVPPLVAPDFLKVCICVNVLVCIVH